jgi:hypothetical protein
MSMITGATNIENVRRMTIRAALRMKVNHDMWPNRHWKSNCLVRTYGWTGRTAKSALEFMEKLGDAVEPKAGE